MEITEQNCVFHQNFTHYLSIIGPGNSVGNSNIEYTSDAMLAFRGLRFSKQLIGISYLKVD